MFTKFNRGSALVSLGQLSDDNMPILIGPDSTSDSGVNPWEYLDRSVANAAFPGETIDQVAARIFPENPWLALDRRVANNALETDSLETAITRYATGNDDSVPGETVLNVGREEDPYTESALYWAANRTVAPSIAAPSATRGTPLTAALQKADGSLSILAWALLAGIAYWVVES